MANGGAGLEAGRERSYQFLGSVQERVYDGLGFDLPSFDQGHRELAGELAAEMDQTLRSFTGQPEGGDQARLLRRIEEQYGRAPSPFEDPWLYGIMRFLCEQIEAAAAKGSVTIPFLPAFGSLPTGQVNALTIRRPGTDDYAVVFEKGMFTFALLVSKVAARLMPFERTEEGGVAFSTDPEDLTRTIAEHPEVVDRFWDLLTAYVVLGDPNRATQYLPQQPYLTLSNMLRNGMELFVVGHEYGHIIENHVGSDRPAALLEQPGVTETQYAWEQEVAADRWGLQLGVQAMVDSDVDVAIAYCGMDLFFTSIWLVEEAVSVVRHGHMIDHEALDPASMSHPPPLVRSAFLRRILVNSLPELGQNAIELADQVRSGILDLWERTQPALMRLHQDGVRPWAMWQEPAGA